MRVTLVVDSATPDEVYALTCAFQRTLGHGLPKSLQAEPMVTVGGSKMGWKSPPMWMQQMPGLLREYALLIDPEKERVSEA